MPGRRERVESLRGYSASTGCNGRTPVGPPAPPPPAPPAGGPAGGRGGDGGPVGGSGSGARGGSDGGVGGAAAPTPYCGYLTGTPASSRLRWMPPQASPTSSPLGRFRLFSHWAISLCCSVLQRRRLPSPRFSGLTSWPPIKPLERRPVAFLRAARTFLAKTAPSGPAIERERSLGRVDDHHVPAVEMPDLGRSDRARLRAPEGGPAWLPWTVPWDPSPRPGGAPRATARAWPASSSLPLCRSRPRLPPRLRAPRRRFLRPPAHPAFPAVASARPSAPRSRHRPLPPLAQPAWREPQPPHARCRGASAGRGPPPGHPRAWQTRRLAGPARAAAAPGARCRPPPDACWLRGRCGR